MLKLLFRWFFTLWFLAAVVILLDGPSKYAWGEETGLLVFIFTFILHAPWLLFSELNWLTVQLLKNYPHIGLIIQGGLLALGLDLLRLHIKKYRECKRIAMQMKK